MVENGAEMREVSFAEWCDTIDTEVAERKLAGDISGGHFSDEGVDGMVYVSRGKIIARSTGYTTLNKRYFVSVVDEKVTLEMATLRLMGSGIQVCPRVGGQYEVISRSGSHVGVFDTLEAAYVLALELLDLQK